MARNADRSVRGQRVLITGGSSGIGLATAEQLVNAGARVVLVARGDAGLRDAASRTGCVATVAADVGDPTQIQLAIMEATSVLGGLDGVIANAGAASYGPFAESSTEDYAQTIRTTLSGVINTTHASLPHLQRSGGTLIVVGSVAGRLPTPWLAAYAAAKHGVRGFVRSLACELQALGTPVGLTLISPGPVDTPFWKRARTPDRRLPPELRGAYRAEDIAAEVLRALRAPRPTERTVGGLFVPAVLLDAFFPNQVLRPLGFAARLGWRARERRPPSNDDAFAEPTTVARRSGGLHGRRSVLRVLKDLFTLASR